MMTTWWSLLASCLLQILGFCIFLKGFFPSKVVLDGFSEFSDLYSPFNVDGKAQFDKVIFMVVDAMRSDFMFSENSNMKYFHSLVSEGNAIPFTAYSNPPTVTLPRLKGITTGGAPSFVDAILNVADDKDDSQGLSKTDSWISQFKRKGLNLHFYGDDTWLKLCPPSEFFDKYEGTNSFFVSDFTEVDFNVTRHLDSELNDSTWDALILHYLGLDHIGHKGGPESVYMKPKQMEMDDVLKRIYESVLAKSENTLMVLLGDHGMNEIGNHGGSSPGETHPGMAFISSKFSQSLSKKPFPVSGTENYEYYSVISQIDLVPTLASLLDFPIPKNNLGIIIPEFLDLWGNEVQQNRILLENCNQLMKLLTSKFSPEAEELQNFEVLLSRLQETTKSGKEEYYSFLTRAQELLAESATNYSYYDIWFGVILIMFSFILSSLQLINFFECDQRVYCGANVVFVLSTLVYSFHFHGSSLIEEEYQIWWFLTITFLSFFQISVKPKKFSLFVKCLLGVRVIRAWSNTGQKFSTPLTVSTTLCNFPNVLWSLNCLTYVTISWLVAFEGGWQNLFSRDKSKLPTKALTKLVAWVIALSISIPSFIFKICQYYIDGKDTPVWMKFLIEIFTSLLEIEADDKKEIQRVNISLSKTFFAIFVAFCALRILINQWHNNIRSTLITDLVNMITFLLIHQSKAEVIPLFLVFLSVRHSFRGLIKESTSLNINEKVLSITAFMLCMQNLSFFSIGNTNLLATVDLSNAYNGIAEYDVFLVAFMTFISNYAVVIFWSFTALELIFVTVGELAPTNFKTQFRNAILGRSILTTFFYGLSMMSLVGSCINLRFHLFIWSVFSPKLLYFASWSILVNIGIDIIIASLFSI